MRSVDLKLRILSSVPTSPNDTVANVDWPPVSGNQECLELGSTVQAGTNPEGERMRFWNDLKASID